MLPYNLHGLAHVSWVGYVQYRPCPTHHSGMLGSDDLDHDPSDVLIIGTGTPLASKGAVSMLRSSGIFLHKVCHCAAGVGPFFGF